MNIQLAVFDIAGTTLLDGDAVNFCLRAALRAVGVETTLEAVNEVMGIAKPVAIEMLLKSKNHAKTDAAFVNEIHADFVRRMLEYYQTSPEIKEIEGVSQTFRILKQNGVKVGLDTGFSRNITDAILERTGWLKNGLVDAVATSDEVEKGRPFPYMIQKIMQETGVTDSAAVLKAGDTPVDLEEGFNANCQYVVGVCSGSFTRSQLSALKHTHILDSINDVPALLGLS